MARARQFPGQEQQVFNFYANNPQAQAEIRAPLFEDKVVDFIAELAEVTEKQGGSRDVVPRSRRSGGEAERRRNNEPIWIYEIDRAACRP